MQQLQLPIQLHCTAKWLELIFFAKEPFRALSFLLSSTTSSMLKRAFANVPIISVCAHKPYVHHYVPLCTTMCTTLSPRSVLGESWTARYRGDWPMLSLSSNQNFAFSVFFNLASDLNQDGSCVADGSAELNLTRVAFHLNSASPANRPNRDDHRLG